MGKIGTATDYYTALEEYSDCWKEKHGEQLRYYVVGHSLGGYEALGIAQAAVNDGRGDLIAKIVTVDGAVQDRLVLSHAQWRGLRALWRRPRGRPNNVVDGLYVLTTRMSLQRRVARSRTTGADAGGEPR